MNEFGLPLRTERLVVRLFTDDDVDDTFAYRGAPEVYRYLNREPWSLERTGQVVRYAAKGWRQDSDDPLVLAVAVAGDNRVIGDIQLSSAPAAQGEIGWVFNPEFAGRGYATEAAEAVLGLAFGSIGRHRVYARLDTENAASIRLCERLGMRREAHLIESDGYNGRWGDEFVYAVLDREWTNPQK